MDSRASTLPHLDLLADVTTRFAAALDGTDPDRPVPSLTGWGVGEVGRHLIEVHRWCAGIVRDGGRPQPLGASQVEGDLAAAYRASAAELMAVLRAVDPDEPRWTMDRADRRAGFWARRQVHEVAVHLWDVRSVDDPTPAALADVPAAVAADGVDELLQLASARIGRTGAPLPGPLALHAVDTGSRWLLGTDWLLEDPSTVEAAARLVGTARGLLLRVWGRGDHAVASGDADVLGAFDRAPLRG